MQRFLYSTFYLRTLPVQNERVLPFHAACNSVSRCRSCGFANGKLQVEPNRKLPSSATSLARQLIIDAFVQPQKTLSLPSLSPKRYKYESTESLSYQSTSATKEKVSYRYGVGVPYMKTAALRVASDLSLSWWMYDFRSNQMFKLFRSEKRSPLRTG